MQPVGIARPAVSLVSRLTFEAQRVTMAEMRPCASPSLVLSLAIAALGALAIIPALAETEATRFVSVTRPPRPP